MHLSDRMTLERLLENYKDGFVIPDYHGDSIGTFSMSFVMDFHSALNQAT